MGITFGSIERMDKLGLFGNGRISVLDIGSSNLYSADAARIEQFLKKYSARALPDANSFAEKLAKGSGYDPVHGGLNQSFVGELFEKAGMEYLAFDIADGYRTQILDLNRGVLPNHLRDHFDLVLNFGTTEHILNQYNCFKVIHDATKVGGFIHHSLPGVGYSDHGYITYTCRCFFDIAGYNEYEVVDFWFDGPGGNNDMLQGLRSYAGYFPALKRSLQAIENSPQGAALRAAAVPDLGINIVCRKVKDKPFWGALESSTSVGNIPDNVTASYAGGPQESMPEPAVVPHSPLPPVSMARTISRLLEPFPALRGLARRVYGAAQAQPVQTPPPSPVAEMALTEAQAKMRDGLLKGDISFDAALQFYAAVVAAHGTFPHEWEERVLRLGMATHPERTDFAERLEVVLGLLGKQPARNPDEAAAKTPGDELPADDAALQNDIRRFCGRALVGLSDPVTIAREFGDAAAEASRILGSPAFARLTVADQVAAIVAIYNTTMSVVLRESIGLADLVSGHFARLLREPQLSPAQAMRLYDCLYGLYFAGAQSVGEMRRFDTGCVLPFESYLRGLQTASQTSLARPLADDATTICYFCHCAHFDKGNAVSPIMASLARSHAERGDRKVYLYCVQWVDQAFVDWFAGSGVVVREFRQDWNYDQCDAIVRQLAADHVDVVVTDLNSSIASYVFARRAAPLQMWVVMAFPYWSLASMDWALLPVLDYQPHYGIAADRHSALRIKQAPVTLIQACNEDALRAARATLPEGAFVFAVFSRLIKVPPVFLGVVRQILLAEPRAHLLIVGTGDPRTIQDLLGDELARKRVTFIHGNVDLNVYGRVIDVMLDTFPFHAGNACREVAIHGKPVVALREPEWGILMDDERDRALVANDHAAYVAVALRLAREADFYASRSAEARSVSLRVTQTVDMIAEVEQAIDSARRHFARSREPSSVDMSTGKPLSRLDQLIVRNVDGKHGGQPFYPGQPDPKAQQFAQFARELFGADSDAVISNTESLLLAYLLNVYRQSTNAPARGLTVDAEVRREISNIYQSNQSVASPLFLATRFLLGRMYSRFSIEEPALELGMGFGDTAKAILGDRTLAVGTTPILDELMGARHHFGNHRQYLAVDAGQIPFADETFSTIVMNYAFYHLEDPARACREMMRVLAPGGRLFFNFAIRDRIEATRVWPRLANELGLRDYGQMASDFVFTDYGGANEIPTKSGCLALLDKCGFADVETTDYLSPELSRLIWLTRDMEILFQMNLHQATARPAVESAYRQFVENQMAALLSHDAALCAAHEGGTFMFVSARKSGSSLKRYDDAEIQNRLICPVAGTPLQRRPGFLWSEQSQLAYPVYQDIALLIPVYGEIWRRQNAKAPPDPAAWAPFSY